IVNERGWNEVQRFSVGEVITSDHMPQQIDIGIAEEEDEENNDKEDETRIQKIVWDEKGVETYKQNLRKTRFDFGLMETKEMMRQLEEVIKKAVKRREIRVKTSEAPIRRWWTSECRDLKIK